MRGELVLNFFGKRLRYMQEVPRQERGFTLIELLIVTRNTANVIASVEP
jgi:hypothetical protein